MLSLRFESECHPGKAVDFLSGPRLWIPKSDYPDFTDWLDKVRTELTHGSKHGIFCYLAGQLVGSVLYQRHKKTTQLLEIKNLTVDPRISRRFVASFLLRNAEVEGQKCFGSTAIICDAKKSNLAVNAFLVRNRYRAVGTIDIYGKSAGTDTVYMKDLVEKDLC